MASRAPAMNDSMVLCSSSPIAGRSKVGPNTVAKLLMLILFSADWEATLHKQRSTTLFIVYPSAEQAKGLFQVWLIQIRFLSHSNAHIYS